MWDLSFCIYSGCQWIVKEGRFSWNMDCGSFKLSSPRTEHRADPIFEPGSQLNSDGDLWKQFCTHCHPQRHRSLALCSCYSFKDTTLSNVSMLICIQLCKRVLLSQIWWTLLVCPHKFMAMTNSSIKVRSIGAYTYISNQRGRQVIAWGLWINICIEKNGNQYLLEKFCVRMAKGVFPYC
jgi:hypothetical protein